MNPADFTFEALRDVQYCGGTSLCTSLAYWIGVLADPTARFAREASFACDVMSYHYDAEEQAVDIDGLRSYPEIIPTVFDPIAPVTLAYRWSPFPAALIALGEPTHFDREHAKALAVFRPVEIPTFPASTADELHFQFLLKCVCERAHRLNHWVLLVGSPGWSYDGLNDYVAAAPSLERLMANFGYIYFARKPRGT